MAYTGTHNSINTVRELAARLWGENDYSLTSDYDFKGKPTSWRTVYTINRIGGTKWYVTPLCNHLREMLELVEGN